MTIIWVTRPGLIGHALCQKLEALGYQTWQASPIEIQPLSVYQDSLKRIAGADWLIFVSPNAVDYYPGPINTQAQLAVIGEATCQALQSYNYSVNLIPQSFSSEGLLQTSAFQSSALKGQNVVIIKGEGGRQELASTLKQRGARVSEVSCYRRQQKSQVLSSDYYINSDWLVVTSQSILQSLWQLTPYDQQSNLQCLPLLVSSQRLVSKAKSMGFQTIYQCDNAHRQAIVDFFYYLQS